MVQSSLAGGGPLNVMVLYNESSTDSEAVANAYQQARMLPFGHTCAVSGLATTEREISFESYTQTIGAAVDTCLSTLPHPNEIDYLVLARGLPYRITLETGFTTSVSAMLQIHHSTTSDNMPIAGSAHAQSNGLYHASVNNPEYVGYDNYSCELGVSNTAQGWYTAACDILKSGELPLSFARDSVSNRFGNEYQNNLFIVTRLDGFNYEDALDLIERGVAADSSYPPETLLCMEGADSARAARDPECELVARHLALAGFNSSYLSPHDANLSGRDLAAYFTGSDQIRSGISENYYAPGSIVGNLTSFGAHPNNFFCNADESICPENEWQTSIARWVRAGATGVHGTVGEPLNNSFPNAGTLLLYTFGYNLGESWFFNQQFLYWQNLYLGDPLSMPFGDRPSVTFPEDNLIIEGEVLSVKADHPFGIRNLELFVNGERISSIEGDELNYIHPFLAGETPEVLAVATAKSKNIERLGWPIETMKNRSRPKGWAKFRLKVSAPAEPVLESCGCNSNIKAHATAITSIPFLLLLFQRRRYPSTPKTLFPTHHQISNSFFRKH